MHRLELATLTSDCESISDVYFVRSAIASNMAFIIIRINSGKPY